MGAVGASWAFDHAYPRRAVGALHAWLGSTSPECEHSVAVYPSSLLASLHHLRTDATPLTSWRFRPAIPMFPITCNAIGDIIAVVQLIYDIVKALDDTRGAVKEYKQFIHVLTALGTVMHAVHDLVKDSHDDILRRNVLQEIQRCCEDINQAQSSIAGFQKLEKASTDRASSRASAASTMFTKLQWHLLKASDAEKFARRFSESHIRLNGFIGLLSHNAMSPLFENQRLHALFIAQEQNRTILRISEDIKVATYNAIQEASLPSRQQVAEQVLASIPAKRKHVSWAKQVAYKIFDTCAPDSTEAQRDQFLSRLEPVAMAGAAYAIHTTLSPQWQATALWAAVSGLAFQVLWMKSYSPDNAPGTPSDVVTLTDVSDETIYVPFQICETLEVFHGFLEHLFVSTGRLGYDFVQKRMYELYHTGSSEVVTSATWSSRVRRGACLVMGVVIMTGCRYHDSPEVECPYCSHEMPSTITEVTRAVVCTRCSRTFWTTDVFASYLSYISSLLTWSDEHRRISLTPQSYSHFSWQRRQIAAYYEDPYVRSYHTASQIARVRIVKVHTDFHSENAVPVDIGGESNAIIDGARANQITKVGLDWMYIWLVAKVMRKARRVVACEGYAPTIAIRVLRQIQEMFRLVRLQYVKYPGEDILHRPLPAEEHGIPDLISAVDDLINEPSIARAKQLDIMSGDGRVEWVPFEISEKCQEIKEDVGVFLKFLSI
ncbi:unnamed protein product [Peniophora sp. CBMAI 1063]|nr:unnamed protein product [Peniophora sp. CBMAI 1063]